MTDEHFGISIIEYMAAGVVAIAHNSGGPRDDILVDCGGERVGYLATSEQEYSDAMIKVLEMSDEAVEKIRRAARKSVRERFSDEAFARGITDAINAVKVK